jgi:DNA-directed RNA polymerase specialized sigma24 family protein
LMDRLPDKLREILLLRVVSGMSAEETGRALGMSPGAVRVAQHRALATLQKYVQSPPARSVRRMRQAGMRDPVVDLIAVLQTA